MGLFPREAIEVHASNCRLVGQAIGQGVNQVDIGIYVLTHLKWYICSKVRLQKENSDNLQKVSQIHLVCQFKQLEH